MATHSIPGPSAPRGAVPRRGHPRVLRAAALVAAVAYLTAMPAYLITHGGWPTPDYLIPPLLLLAIVVGRGWPFVFDWGPFLVLILAWQATASIADELGRPVHVRALPAADRWLFDGRLPTVLLQERLWDPTAPRWYDWAATAQHTLHFVLPVLIGLVIWLHSRRTYWRYVLSVIVLFFLGFAGYALYPAAPPWMAGMQEVIPPVNRIAVETVAHLPGRVPIGLAYTHFSYNQVAAMPSLHAALPLLLALVLVRLGGWRALPALLYPLAMGFNLVYLGEHYVIDVLAGFGVAVAAYLLVWALPDFAPLPHARLPWRSAIGVPVALRRAGDAALPLLAAASIAVIVFTLRPDRPASESGPLIPGLQVQAGQPETVTPARCGETTSPNTALDHLLAPHAGQYAVYLFDLDEGTCYVLSASAILPPPPAERVFRLAARAPVRLAPVPGLRRGVEYAALHTGGLGPALIDAGLPPSHRYLLAVELADVADPEAGAATADEIAALVIGAQPGPEAEPDPEAEPESE